MRTPLSFTSLYRTPEGFDNLWMSSDGEALTGLWFEGARGAGERVCGEEVPNLPVFRETRRWLDVYFSGRQPDFAPRHRIDGLTPFRRAVTDAMLAIPFGETTTYGGIAGVLAEKLGLAKMSAQAVGQAVGWNPLCLIVPCHRVLGAANALTGYGGGIRNKVALLRLEGHDVLRFTFPRARRGNGSDGPALADSAGLAAARRLTAEDYRRDAVTMAKALLGAVLCRRLDDGTVLRARITETEAYFGEEDTACHAHHGRTPRTDVMYAPGGRAYVYLCYGMHEMLNVVTGPADHPEAVLVRGVEGAEGPGRLTKTMQITRELNREDLVTSHRLWIETGGTVPRFRASPRIGIGYASKRDQMRKWRFVRYE